MRILVLVPSHAALAVTRPLVDLGHTVWVVSTTRGPVPPAVAPGAVTRTKGHLYGCVRSLKPQAVVWLQGDTEADLMTATTPLSRPLEASPELHALPWPLPDPDGLLELLSVLFPPVVPEELEEWLSGPTAASVAKTALMQAGPGIVAGLRGPEHDETPATPKRRRGSKDATAD